MDKRSSAIRLFLAGEGSSPGGAAGVPNNTHFRSVSYIIGAPNCIGRGMVSFIYTKQIKETSRDMRATCGDDGDFFMLLVFAQAHYIYLYDVSYHINI